MNNFPNASLLETTNVSDFKSEDFSREIQLLTGLLTYNNLGVEVRQQDSGKAIIITVPENILEKFTGTPENEVFCATFMRTTLFSFQELLSAVENKKIEGFAIVPPVELSDVLWAQQRTEFIGRTLQSLCKGEISLL